MESSLILLISLGETLHSIEELTSFIYKSTGKKIYWHMGSCCHELSALWSSNDFNELKYSTSIHDADILIIGTKLGQDDFDFLKSNIDSSNQEIVAFGNCTISGGIFKKANQLFSIESIINPHLIIPGCPPTFENLKRQLVKFLGLDLNES